jgi:hypothetical protein
VARAHCLYLNGLLFLLCHGSLSSHPEWATQYT